MKKVYTLCVPVKDNMVLLGMKKIGFGAGRFNGFGGKVEEGESIVQAAVRELEEEAGVQAGEIKKAGVLEFSFEEHDKLLQVHIYKVTDFAGEPSESDEMKPQWFRANEIPFTQMWPDDEYWFPYLLNDKLFEGAFHFDRPSDAEYTAKIISQTLAEVVELP